VECIKTDNSSASREKSCLAAKRSNFKKVINSTVETTTEVSIRYVHNMTFR
jgi:hypothetical protein